MIFTASECPKNVSFRFKNIIPGTMLLDRQQFIARYDRPRTSTHKSRDYEPSESTKTVVTKICFFFQVHLNGPAGTRGTKPVCYTEGSS